ncbi:MAG: hypothetical protein QOI46_5156 [Alphaproteobacteria bacterium]|jgi:hypothetical protein|nr:hypothetical protein [Alphaproteobacteria bacterium]MEA2965058.1 hypothetical protein [Alphaproteobacteria bacterium]
MANHLISGLFSGLSLRALARAMGRVPTNELTATESASTLFRFFRSKHVRDLKLIFTTALFVLALHLLLVVLLGLINAFFSAAEAPQLAAQVQGSVSPAAPAGPLTGLVNAAGRFLSFFISYVGPGVPIYGVIVGWAYRTASTRLGIVDLFACEISTLCRVGTIFDIGKRYVDTYDAGPAPARPSAAASGKFVSQEEYFPVFDSNSRDLQQLEASVVNNITEFYTYMKSTRDSLRKLADMPAQPAAPDRAGAATDEPDAWHDAMLNVIYLLFLGYESARKAVNDLIEFQPARAERSIVILLTELKCYAFLRQHFTSDDLRRKRLELREDGYRRDIRKLYREVKASAGHSDELWVQARETLPVLVSRYNEALDDDLEANF